MPLATNANVLTPSGYKNVEAIAVGDVVVTPIGEAKVLCNGKNTNFHTPFIDVAGVKMTGSIRLLTPDLKWSVVTARNISDAFSKTGFSVEYLFADSEIQSPVEADSVFSFSGPVAVVRPPIEEQYPIFTRRLITDNGLMIVSGMVAFGFFEPPIDLSRIPAISSDQLDAIKRTYF